MERITLAVGRGMRKVEWVLAPLSLFSRTSIGYPKAPVGAVHRPLRQYPAVQFYQEGHRPVTQTGIISYGLLYIVRINGARRRSERGPVVT